MTPINYHSRSIELRIALPRGDGQTRSFLPEADGTIFAFRNGAFLHPEFALQARLQTTR